MPRSKQTVNPEMESNVAAELSADLENKSEINSEQTEPKTAIAVPEVATDAPQEAAEAANPGDEEDVGIVASTPDSGAEDASTDNSYDVPPVPSEQEQREADDAKLTRSQRERLNGRSRGRSRVQAASADSATSTDNASNIVANVEEVRATIQENVRPGMNPGAYRYNGRDAYQDQRDNDQEQSSAINRVTTSFNNRNILYYEIAGVETDDNEAYWVCYDESVKIRIPFTHSFMSIPQSLYNPEQNRRISGSLLERRQQFLRKAIGANIAVVITGTGKDEKSNFIATASRTTALAKQRRRYFGRTAQTPVAVGQDVTAHIISVGDHAIYVTACGVDSRVPVRGLSFRYMARLTDFYNPGEDIKMRITAIDESGEIPQFTLSARDIEVEESIRPRLAMVIPRSTYIGTVVSIRREMPTADSIRRSQCTISLWLNGVEIPAYSRTVLISGSVKTGDRVVFQVHGVTDALNMAHGKIIQRVRGGSF